MRLSQLPPDIAYFRIDEDDRRHALVAHADVTPCVDLTQIKPFLTPGSWTPLANFAGV